MKKENSSELITELKNYIEIIKKDVEIDSKELCASNFQKILKDFSNVLEQSEEWEKKYSVALNILYPFSPRMGGFSEYASKDLLEKGRPLIEKAETFLKYCWQKQGKKVNYIKKDKLFKAGSQVYLVKRELMYISYGGYKDYADFAENHTYEIIEQLGNDVTNMPQYLIKCDNFTRVVRHNALTLKDA
jgi:hypothetical protein